MSSQERALKIISMMSHWRPGDPARLSEATKTEKAEMIAKWGLRGAEARLNAAEQKLGIDTK